MGFLIGMFIGICALGGFALIERGRVHLGALVVLASMLAAALVLSRAA